MSAAKKPKKQLQPEEPLADEVGKEQVEDEYDHDSSDEEDLRNTVGDIPMWWYNDYDHIGYDTEGKKILRPEGGDKIDDFLDKMENPDYWRTVIDQTTGQKVVLSDADVQLVKNICSNRFITPEEDQYPEWIDFFTHEVEKYPLIHTVRSKGSFLPSKWDAKKVSSYVNAIKRGWLVPKTEAEKDAAAEEKRTMKFYNLWSDDAPRQSNFEIAPKQRLPGHAESYNPPPEYIFTKEELLKWRMEPDHRRLDFIPERFESMRKISLYHDYMQERFDRCMDLYMCPRKKIMRSHIEPEALLPELPKMRDLQPFPSALSITFSGHTDVIKTISTDPSGQWFASGSNDKTVRFWEVNSGRCMKVVHFEDKVDCVAWNPNGGLSLVAVTSKTSLYLITPGLGDVAVTENTNQLIKTFAADPEAEELTGITWTSYEETEKKYEEGFRLRIDHDKPTLHLKVTWHGRGDYFAVLLPKQASWSLLIHQLSKRRSQKPYKKNYGYIQDVQFHPTKPYLVMASQRYIRIFNLLKQNRVKKLYPTVKWISSLAIHPQGDNIICGSYDCKVNWFDLDLSRKPYKTLKKHGKAIRDVAFHRKYPLFASVSDDGSAIVCHSTVYDDLLKNPLIIPVKVLKGHKITRMLGGLSCMFHPTQPWLFTSGADGNIQLFT